MYRDGTFGKISIFFFTIFDNVKKKKKKNHDESDEKVMYRDGTFGLPGEAEGSSWTKVSLIKYYHG